MPCAIGVEFLPRSRNRHQRRNIAPKVIATKVPASSPDPSLRTADVLDNQRDVSAGRFAGLALNPEANFEERVIRWRQGLRLLPRHGTIRIRLTWGRSNNHRSVFELRAVEREYILNHELPGIPACSVVMPLNVKAHHIETFSQESFSPSAKPAVKINRQRLQVQHSHCSARLPTGSMSISACSISTKVSTTSRVAGWSRICS